jgi:hypothetical protein
MKQLHKLTGMVLFGAAWLMSHGLAQTASLTAAARALAPGGGEIALQAALGYNGKPSALGWSIVLPEGWSMARVDGAQAPQVAPEPGTTGALEFAYTTVPDYMANFAVIVHYPAGAGAATITSSVIVRADGKLITLTPAPVDLHRL